MSNYEHSEVFASLKNIHEEVPHNLTTAQWLQTLDHFVESALDPIATAWPSFLDSFFAKVVGWQIVRPAIKFSRIEKADLSVHFFNAATTEGRVKRAHQRKMLLNRGVLLGCARQFLATVNDYRQVAAMEIAYRPSVRRTYLNQFEEITGGSHLYAAILQVEHFERKASHFKSLIMQKYVRLALNNARRVYKIVEYRERLDDVVQAHLHAMSRAIDRCDERQGVLTTFVQSWFHSARCEIQRRVQESIHASYDALSGSVLQNHYTDFDSTAESIQHLAHVAQAADPIGVVRYSLGIPEFYSRAQLDHLRLFISATADSPKPPTQPPH